MRRKYRRYIRSTGNKVKFNIKNVHYAVKTAEKTYDTPVPIPGAVSISLEQQGELTPFWADGIKYYDKAAIYQFREDVLGEKADQRGVLFENTNTATVEFALGFQVDGDTTPTLFWFYNCTATRPSIDASTTEDTKEPNTDTLTVSCGSTSDGTVRAKTTDTSYAAVKDTWFTDVYQKSEEA